MAIEIDISKFNELFSNSKGKTIAMVELSLESLGY